MKTINSRLHAYYNEAQHKQCLHRERTAVIGCREIKYDKNLSSGPFIGLFHPLLASYRSDARSRHHRQLRLINPKTNYPVNLRGMLHFFCKNLGEVRIAPRVTLGVKG